MSQGLGIISGYYAFMKNGMKTIKVPTLWKHKRSRRYLEVIIKRRTRHILLWLVVLIVWEIGEPIIWCVGMFANQVITKLASAYHYPYYYSCFQNYRVTWEMISFGEQNVKFTTNKRTQFKGFFWPTLFSSSTIRT